jgi:hypothetical protein
MQRFRSCLTVYGILNRKPSDLMLFLPEWKFSILELLPWHDNRGACEEDGESYGASFYLM